MLLCPRYWLRLKGFVWVYLLPAWCWSDRQKGAVFCSDIVMYQLVVNVRALAWAQVCVCWWYAFMCAHLRKCIMHHIAWVSLLPVRVCLWAKVYTKLYRGNSFIHLSNYTPHLTFKGEEIAAWFWLIVDFKALHKAKQCWHTVLTAAGSEKLSGMSGHTKCILTQAIPIRCFVSLMKPRPQWERDCAERANPRSLTRALTQTSVRSLTNTHTRRPRCCMVIDRHDVRPACNF